MCTYNSDRLHIMSRELQLVVAPSLVVLAKSRVHGDFSICHLPSLLVVMVIIEHLLVLRHHHPVRLLGVLHLSAVATAALAAPQHQPDHEDDVGRGAAHGDGDGARHHLRLNRRHIRWGSLWNKFRQKNCLDVTSC